MHEQINKALNTKSSFFGSRFNPHIALCSCKTPELGNQRTNGKKGEKLKFPSNPFRGLEITFEKVSVASKANGHWKILEQYELSSESPAKTL
jgi:hypothetical protein